jgi:hypothetical protein
MLDPILEEAYVTSAARRFLKFQNYVLGKLDSREP